jgi:hypothetical protein
MVVRETHGLKFRPYYSARRRKWWTRERVIEGLLRFYRDFGVAVTDGAVWHRMIKFTGANRGIGNPYPGRMTVMRHFKSFCEAWAAAGIPVIRKRKEWSPEDDRFLAAANGVLSRQQIATCLGRTRVSVNSRCRKRGIYIRGPRRSAGESNLS